MYVEGEPMTGKMQTAMGVAPRIGVLGTPVAVEDPYAMLKMLAEMKVKVENARGEVLAEVPGHVVMRTLSTA